MTQFIACKKYDEKITTIHTCKSYRDAVRTNQESNQQQEQQQVQKNKRIKRILLMKTMLF
jgi:hypothetical protein